MGGGAGVADFAFEGGGAVATTEAALDALTLAGALGAVVGAVAGTAVGGVDGHATRKKAARGSDAARSARWEAIVRG